MENLTSNTLISQVRELVINQAKSPASKNTFWSIHIPLVVKWTNTLLESHPEANKEIALLGAWLHDVGHVWPSSSPDEDHAVRGEAKARQILENLGVDEERVTAITKIVRRHRNRDVKPEAIEEKIVAAADSATHFDQIYRHDILKDSYFGETLKDRIENVLSKLERDWHDISVFSELAEKLKEKYETFKKEIQAQSLLPADSV